MKLRRRGGKDSSNGVRLRTLRFDLLEPRQMFAGLGGELQVLVFQDPQSLRLPSSETSPASERVVFVDLNRDGSFQSTEPWSITDSQGYAKFNGLAPGSYSVRLLSHRSVSETTSTQPASSGDWFVNPGVKQWLEWESDTIGWFAGTRSIKKLDLSRGVVLNDLEIDGAIASVRPMGRSHWIALVENSRGSQLISVDRQSGTTQEFPILGVQSFAVVGDDLFALATQGAGAAVYKIPNILEGSVDVIPSKLIPVAPRVGGVANSIHAIGPRDLILVESVSGDTRISSWQYQADSWQLAAERFFEGIATFSSHLRDAHQFVIETGDGLMVVNNTLGLPTVELLEQATGSVVFDPSRGTLWSASRSEPKTILGWSSVDWSPLFEIPLVQSTAEQSTDRIELSMGFLNDSLIARVNNQIYQHSLLSSVGTAVSISDSSLKQIAIGIRARGDNRPPTLGELPSLAGVEDVPIPIPYATLTSRSNDGDGDPMYYFVRSLGTKGQMRSSSTDFALFVPEQNAYGEDHWSVQAFDGLAWSALQSLRIDLRPENDPPSMISGSNEYLIPELQEGVLLGAIGIVDPDIDAAYRYTVDDDRFVISDGVLSLRPGVSLDYEASSTLVLTLTAVEINRNDSISKRVTVLVQDRNDPPQGIRFEGSGSFAEKRGLAMVGTVGVIDQDAGEIYHISVSDSRFEIVGSTLRVKDGPGIDYQEPGWVEISLIAASRSTGDTIRRTERLRLIKDPTPYHNDENPLDVDGDGVVSPLDPLAIINYINHHGPGTVPAGEGEGGGQIDVDGDGQVTPLDILIIINALNGEGNLSGGSTNSPRPGTGSRPSGEGEGSIKVPAALSVPTAVPPFQEEELPGRRPRRLLR